ELEGQPVAAVVEQLVHSVGIRVGRRAGLGVHAVDDHGCEPPEADEPQVAIGLERTLSEDLREAALPHPPVEIHLKEPVLRGREALEEEEVVWVPREDMRHAPRVTHDLTSLIQSEETD